MKCVPRRRADDIIAMNETARFTDCTSTRNDSLPKLILQYSYLYTTTIHSWGQARFLFFFNQFPFHSKQKKNRETTYLRRSCERLESTRLPAQLRLSGVLPRCHALPVDAESRGRPSNSLPAARPLHRRWPNSSVLFFLNTVESGYIIHGYIIQPLILAIFGWNRIFT